MGWDVAIRVDVLPNQGDLARPQLGEGPELREDARGLPTSLSPPHVGHDAVRAEVIAAPHDAHELGERRLGKSGPFLVRLAGVDARVDTLHALGRRGDHVRQAIVAVGADDKVHAGAGPRQRVPKPLGHAPHHAEDRAGGHETAEVRETSQGPPLRALPDAAGVDDDGVGLGGALDERVAALGEHRPDHLGVVLVHLAAVCLDVDPHSLPRRSRDRRSARPLFVRALDDDLDEVVPELVVAVNLDPDVV